MRSKFFLSRRRFLASASAAAGGLLLPVNKIFADGQFNNLDDYPFTKHFWYRKAPENPYIDSQRANKAFGFSGTEIFLSEDNSRTWPHRLAFADARNITFSHIFKNGNVLFATQNKLFLSTDNLGTYKEIILKDKNGKDYFPHKPQNPEFPGWYFNTLTGINSWQIDGKEILVWGNYGNVAGGATPTNIYYSTDNGESVKLAYSFGQNPFRRDNGARGGDTGTLLGDADNNVFCRHIHSVAYNPVENAFYACTGDSDRSEFFECHWLRGTYDSVKDKWDWKVIITNNLNSRYKAGGINFVDGKLYWISDANGPEPHDRGLFCCDPSDIGDTRAHTMLFNPKYECGNMIIQDGVILAGHYAVASPFTLGIIYSPDMGKTWIEYDLKEFGPRSPIKFHEKNSEGWFRFDIRSGWIDRADVLFIKPK